MLVFLIFLIFSTYNSYYNYVNAKINNDLKYEGEYDFIIVGCGTAGSVLANRLTEEKNWTVLVLEAGNETSYLTKIPTLAPFWYNTTFNWNYLSEPEKNIFKGLNKQQMKYISGKMLGGTSSINYMIYSRGNKEDYNKWGKIYSSWSYDNVLPYFLKSENSNLNFIDMKYHNINGPLNIQYSYIGEDGLNFIEAANQLGYNITEYNGENQMGFSQIQSNQKNGVRWGTLEAYLNPIIFRKNLKIQTLAKVTKLIINKHGDVRGVKFLLNNIKYQVFAKKEIILCAGTFNTPQLLILSGIGPKEHLKELNISIILDEPSVGQNLQDHITYIGLSFNDNNNNKTKYTMINEYLKELPNWYITGRGILTKPAGFEAIGYIKSSKTSIKQNYPDFEILYQTNMLNIPLIKSIYNINETFFNQFYLNDNTKETIYPILLHPKSRGYIKLLNKNPNQSPKIYPNFYNNTDDLNKMIDGIKLILKFLNTQNYKKFNKNLKKNLVPECGSYFGDLYWECALKSLTVTAHDPHGTCIMGNNGVVNDKFIVKGLKKLRIVDASTIPVTISGHLGAVVIMMAERAADFIKQTFL